MEKLILKNAKVTAIAVFVIAFTSLLVYAFPGGITGRTLKTTTSGCSCHNNQRTTDVGVSFAGPDTVTAGQTAMFTLTVSKQSKTGAGLDIATRNGTLAPVSNTIHLSSGELTHNANIPMTSGSATVQFSYTAPNSGNIDTLWATGLATNSDGHTSGDDWNWATSKRIIIGSPNGVRNLSGEVPGSYALGQNYPNPFNPSTKINFSLPKSSNVKLAVYDMNGREVEVLLNQNLQAGIYEADWHPVNLASGIYFYSLKTNDFTGTKKMIFVK
jgi:Secretion system C-terminal sorting domain